MTTIGVIYFSGTGTTAATAAAVIEGARELGAEVLDLRITGADIIDGRWQNEAVAAQLDNCQGIIFGTPTYMGSTSAQLKAFFDAMAPRWYTQAWQDKVASGFTASSLSAGDKSSTFVAMSTFAMQMGMIWCGTAASFAQNLNPNGFYFGAGATASAPDQLTDIDLATARHVGRRVTEISNRLQADV